MAAEITGRTVINASPGLAAVTVFSPRRDRKRSQSVMMGPVLSENETTPYSGFLVGSERY